MNDAPSCRVALGRYHARMDLDVVLFRAVNGGLGCDAIDPVAAVVSQRGSYTLVAVLAVLVFFGPRSRVRAVLAIAASALVTAAIVWGLKKLVHAPRPGDVLPDVRLVTALGAGVLHTRSWPSGHASLAFSLVVPFVLARPRTAPVLVVPVLVAFSRVYVGAHWPSDVAAGALFGTLSGFLAHVLFERAAPETKAPPPIVEKPAGEPEAQAS